MATLDSTRWYDNGRWGEMGYACPAIPRNNTHTNNAGIKSLADRFGHNLFGLMHQPDVNTTAPPKLTFLVGVHKAVEQFRRLMTAKVVNHNEIDLRTTHVTPAPEPFKIFPVPYFRVRNEWAKRWCQLGLVTLSELIQHQDNIHPMSVHEDLAKAVRPFIDRVYAELAIEFFNKKKEDVQKDGFVLTDADFKAYSPDMLFTSTERVDMRAPLLWNVSETDLAVLAEGIEAPLVLPFIKQWPLDFAESFHAVDQQGKPAGDLDTPAPPPASSIVSQV